MKSLLTISCFFLLLNMQAQLSFNRDTTVRVNNGTRTLRMPWAGGHNYCQFSDIDLDFDNIKDLFVFDRSGNKITTYLNKGTPGVEDYVYSDQFTDKFPSMVAWAILLDYNCDGKEDLFTYASPVAGIKVWKNTSAAGNLQFTMVKDYIRSNYNPSVTNLYVSQVDIPAIEDVDGDGDMDVLTFDFTGTIVEFHKNLSAENGYGCDSLLFQLDPNGCWGNFSESPSNCSIILNQSCRTGAEYPLPPLYETSERHSGSCSLCLDMDADGDKDLIVGDVSCCNMTLLTNGGNATGANMTAFEDSFPSNTTYVMQTVFPCGYFLDVNNDGKRDLLVSPNQPNLSFDQQSIWYYRNIQSDSAPVFSFVKKDFLQDEMIDVGEGAYPVLFDYDNDGLNDLVISDFVMVPDTDSCISISSCKVFAYRNNGTNTTPSFILDTTDFAGLSGQIPGLYSLYPTFGDLDGDGDNDMMIGEYNGQLYYFENTAGPSVPCQFILSQSAYQDDAGSTIDVGSYSTPQLVDVNRDGLLDLIIGERAGNLNYYENIGTSGSPSFTFMTDSFGYINVRLYPNYGFSVPDLVDYNGNHLLFIGSYDGRIFACDSIDGNLSGRFAVIDSSFQNIREGEKSAVTLKDLNGDFIPEMIAGNFGGGVSFWKGTDTLTTGVLHLDGTSSFFIFPNPSNGRFRIQGPVEKIQNITIFDQLGNRIHIQPFKASDPIIDLQENRPGIYYCRILSRENTNFLKMIILR